MYTAFGELVEMTGSRVTRYGYAGGWGYQEHDTDGAGGSGDGEPDNRLLASPTDGFPFLHLGHRYYDPAIGRFLQRDPIGIAGGRNVYTYVNGNPTIQVDANGLMPLAGHNPNIPGDGPHPIPTHLSKSGKWATDTAPVYLFCTGGAESWLDDPATVRKVQKTGVLIAAGVGIGLLPLPVGVKILLGIGAGGTNIWAW